MLKVLLLIAVLDVSWASLESSKLALKGIPDIKGEKKWSSIYVSGKSSLDVGGDRGSWRREMVLDDQEAAGDEARPTFKPFSQEELNHYLKKYADTQHDPKGVDSPNRLQSDSIDDKSKSWHLVHSQTHNHPYDDRMGWVTLEPVAWSQGKVQKWEPNKPPKPHWEQNEPPPYKRPERPYKPSSYDYKPGKPQHWDSEPQYTYGKPSYQSWNSNPDIITDNRPSQFPEPAPSYQKPWYEGRPHTEVVYQGGQGEGRPSGHPGDGDGQWVLISSTKGYSYPNRKGYQRSINVTPNMTISSHRTVRLTVLPALNDTIKTTTSHGGLLEVESTSQTVDEAQREHAARMLRLEKLDKARSTRKPSRTAANRRSSTHFTVIPVNSHTEETRNKALLAAVGAGMIPATVAMILPALAGRKKRSLPANATLLPLDHLLVQYM